MSVRESLFSELQTLCKDARIAFTKTRQELSEFIGDEELVDYCATKGPLPDSPDAVFNVFLLGNKCLYDYEVKQQGSLQHILILRAISEITEEFEKQENEDYLSVSFISSGLESGLVLQGKLADKKNIHRFTGSVIRKVSETTHK